MKIPSLSIIIPCYNGEKWIEPCLQSILIQSYTDFEVIIVNDGSTDDSLEILNNISMTDERITIVDIQNRGVSCARNIGISRAYGQWLTFVDIDDTLPTNSLSVMMQLANDNDIDIVFAGYNHITDRKRCYYNGLKSKRLSNVELAFELFRPADFPYLGYPWGKLFRRSVIERHNVRFDETVKYNEDRLFLLEFLSHARCGAYSTMPVYNYIQHVDSAMAKIEGPDFWKFETDLDAFVRMNIVASRFQSKELVRLIREGTIISYIKNRKLNQQYGNNLPETNKRLKQKLNSSVPLWFIFMNRVATLRSSITYKLRQIIQSKRYDLFPQKSL